MEIILIRFFIVMAAEGKAIIFYRCNLLFYFVSIDERPAMESQPNLAIKSKMVSIYKCPQKFANHRLARWPVVRATALAARASARGTAVASSRRAV